MPACNVLGPGAASFVIRVDSISAPDSLRGTDSLRSRYWGVIGPSGCWSLDHVERTRSPNELALRFVGSHVQATCTQAFAQLDFVEVLAPPFGNPFTIRVTQPGNRPASRYRA